MTAVTTTAAGLLLLAYCRRSRSSAMFVWAVAMIAASAGLVATAIVPHHDRLSSSLATSMLLAACGLFWAATRLFRGLMPRPLWIAAGPAVWLAATPLHTDSPGWTALSCAIGAVYTVLSTREVHCTRSEGLPSWRLATFLLGAHAAIYIARAALAALGALDPGWAVTPDWVVPALIAEAMVHINGMALVLMALLLERHEIRANETLTRAAYLDQLTGIANRRRFDERIVELAADRRWTWSMVGLILLDLDYFKSVNDVAGHEEGDRILRTIAQLIAGEIRTSSDLVARYGGEEFALLLAGTSMAKACGVAERIRAAVVGAEIPHPGTGGFVTVSGGVEVVPAAQLLSVRDVLIVQADRGLYEAKRRGRNQIVAASELEGARLYYHSRSA